MRKKQVFKALLHAMQILQHAVSTVDCMHIDTQRSLYLNVCIPRIMNRIKNELAGCSSKTDSHSPSRGSNDMLQRLSVGVRDFEYSVVVSVPSLVSLYLLSRCCLSTHAANNFASFYEPM